MGNKTPSYLLMSLHSLDSTKHQSLFSLFCSSRNYHIPAFLWQILNYYVFNIVCVSELKTRGGKGRSRQQVIGTIDWFSHFLHRIHEFFYHNYNGYHYYCTQSKQTVTTRHFCVWNIVWYGQSMSALQAAKLASFFPIDWLYYF